MLWDPQKSLPSEFVSAVCQRMGVPNIQAGTDMHKEPPRTCEFVSCFGIRKRVCYIRLQPKPLGLNSVLPGLQETLNTDNTLRVT